MQNTLVIPSIDIHNGKTARVVQGVPELNSKDYGNDPVEMAMIWRTENAKILHVVDLDSAQKHKRDNFDVISEICNSVVIPVEMGGGIKSLDDAKAAFDLGVYRLVIGSICYENPREFYKIFEHYGPQLIVAAIDVFGNEVVYDARNKHSGLNPIELANQIASVGVNRIIVTDVKNNGMLGGPNIELSKKIAIETKCKITVSGGLRGYEDLILVSEESELGIDSVIVGRALYENKFPCQKIWRYAESGLFDEDDDE